MLCNSAGQAWQCMTSPKSACLYAKQYREASTSEVQILPEYASKHCCWQGTIHQADTARACQQALLLGRAQSIKLQFDGAQSGRTLLASRCRSAASAAASAAALKEPASSMCLAWSEACSFKQ